MQFTRTIHAGVFNTVAALRQQYWIPSARQLVKWPLRKCVPCRKELERPYLIPESPPLPQSCAIRKITSVDLTGALQVRNSGHESKVYLCLCTYMQSFQGSTPWSCHGSQYWNFPTSILEVCFMQVIALFNDIWQCFDVWISNRRPAWGNYSIQGHW